MYKPGDISSAIGQNETYTGTLMVSDDMFFHLWIGKPAGPHFRMKPENHGYVLITDIFREDE